MTIEETIVDFVHATTFNNIDSKAVETAHKSIIDILGVSLAGSRDPEIRVLEGLARTWGGTPQCGVLGYSTRLPAPTASLVNGAASRVLDFDDVVDPLGTHPSVAIFAPLLAICQLRKTPVYGPELLAAMVIGQDLSVRLARARRETLLQSGRYDLSKVIASTAAAGRLYGLSEEKLHNAMGIAYTSALGETQCMIDGTSTVFYQQGLVASNAVKAVLLAEQGFTGANSFLSGRWGYYSAFEPGSNPSSIVYNLGKEYTNIENIAFKPYPTCRPNISAATLALELFDGREIIPSDIERIDVKTNQQIFDLVCAPIQRKQNPTTVVDARFSLAYNVAAALFSNGLFISDFSENALSRQHVVDLSRKVFSESSSECNDSQLGTHGRIKISIMLTSGEQLAGDISTPKGNPNNPMSIDEIKSKFFRCLEHTGDDRLITNANLILNAIQQLRDDSYRIDKLTSLIFS